MGGELTGALLLEIRKSATTALTQEAKIAKELDSTVITDGKTPRKLTEVEKQKFWEEIYELAELERKLGDFIIHSSDEISETFIKNIVKQVRESTGLKNFDINLVDRNNEKYKKLFEQWKKGGG